MVSRLRTPADVGSLIRARRQELGLDQAGLARRVGVSRLWVNQIERGKPGASLGLVLRALGVLGVELRGGGAEDVANKAASGFDPVVTPDIDAIIANARRRQDS